VECRYTWDEVATKHVKAVDQESKEGATVMITNDVAGKLLPFMIVVKGKTFKSLEKFTRGNHEKWNAPGSHLTAAARTKFLSKVQSENVCTDHCGTPSIQSTALPCIYHGLA
jgi:hypothetical protein